MNGPMTIGRRGLASLAAAGMLLALGAASVHAEVRVRKTGSTPAEPYDTWENAANNIPTAIDLAGNPRYSDHAVDMGAYETMLPLAGSLFLPR